jgi:hypothetical protein
VFFGYFLFLFRKDKKVSTMTPAKKNEILIYACLLEKKGLETKSERHLNFAKYILEFRNMDSAFKVN